MLGQHAHIMPDIIRNIKDQHFKSLVDKLKAAGWISDAIHTPKTKDSLGNVEFIWAEKGQLLASTYKSRLMGHPLWGEAYSFVRSLNEQEEAFFHENFLAHIPDVSDIPPKP